ncbi:hypothetical protein VaNZ11_011767 [Volvox africanus]|uniref:APAF-1 helical domain-containing protein n=1 Tax=Volvox africanus TaxID=51714 RepID=A0ABQ5SDI7_9CHLO|nr:hypothetical protein VaNZ11_011767 [Volvox africanus]
MGCAQSSQSSGGGTAAGGSPGEESSGKHASVAATGRPDAPLDEGAAASSLKKQVRDSVHDINGGTAKATKEDAVDTCKSCVSTCDCRDPERGAGAGDKAILPGSVLPLPSTTTASTVALGGDAVAVDLPASQVSAGGSLDGVRRSSDTIAAVSTPAARNSSVDKLASNRSSFAAEGIPQHSQMATVMAARGSRGGPADGGGNSPLPLMLEVARSSAQARMSSIQAADVMGLGGDKAAMVPRAMLPAYDPLPGFQPPAALANAYPLLGAVPLDTPVPMEVLGRLWRSPSSEATLGTARAFASLGILRLASLEDGSCWALPAPQHVAHAAAVWPDMVTKVHKQLVEAYSRRGTVALDALRDDGYIIQALSHHLVGSGQLDSLRRLLMNPGWLEAKLHAYGVGAVVRDFRRFLQEAVSEEEALGVKLLLQAFQLSLGAAMEHPTARMLREQMLARLMAVAAGGRLKDWFAEQTSKCAAESMLAANSRLLHLMPRSPSLAQAGGVQRMTLRGHAGPIPRVAIAPNCCEVVTISEDGLAQVWDMNIGDCVMHLARSAPLTAVGITPDSSAAVVAAADGTAAVWNLTTGQVIHNFKGHTGRINCLAIDKQGIRVITGSEDHTGRVWNLQNGECEAVLQGHGGASGLVGSVLDVCVCADGTLAVTVSDDFSGRVWDLDEDGEQLHVLEGHGGWVTSAAFVGTSHRVVTTSHDTTARIWDALRGRCLFVLTGHSGRLNRVSVDPGGSWAITASDDRTARVWDCETGELKLVLDGHNAHVTDAAITRDGRKAITVSGDGTCGIWDMDKGKREALLEGHTGEVSAVALTQRGRFAVTAGEDFTARVWDLAAAAERLTPAPTHGGKVSALQSLPDGQLVVSAGDDGRVFLWDPVEGVCLKQLDGHRVGIRFMRVSAEGDCVLTGSGDRQINHWNWAAYSAAASVVGVRRSLERRELMLHTLTTGGSGGGQSLGTKAYTGGAGGGACSTANIAPACGTGSQLFSTGGTVITAGGATNVEGGDRSERSSEEDPMAALAALKPPGSGGNSNAVMAPRITSGSIPQRVVVPQRLQGSTAGSPCTTPSPHGGTLRPCKSLLEMVSTLQHEPLRASMPAQQGSRVKHMAFDAACRTAAVLLFDSTVSVWDVVSGKCTVQLIRRGERDAMRTHSGGVNAVYLTRDGLTAVTISKDNTARVWDVAAATTRFVVDGHTDGLVAADISGDEQLLATAAYDKTVRVTRLGNGTPVAVLDHPQPPTMVCFSPNNRWMAVGLEDHTVVVWDLVNRCCLPSLDAHKGPLAVLTWSSVNRFLLTAGQDCTLRLWRIEDCRQQAFFMGDAAITAACFAGNSVPDIVVAGDSAGTVHFLDFAEELQGWST